ncbi:MAG: dockerin type I repeat-containing protein, partial [Candidatus Zixiibacteriota bacterium]
MGNADIFGSGSFDGGNTWGKVLNLTGTLDPGCAAGDCRSEHMPSLALNMEAGDLHVEYICDLDAGFGIYDEGVWTENPVMYMRVPEWVVEAGPRGDHRIEEPAHWWHPPIKVLPNQTRSITFKVFSIGNEALTYSVSSDHPCIQVSVPPTQLEPKDSIEISVLLDGTGACNGSFIAGNVILSTDEAGGTVNNLRVHAVVADDYYECPRDPETFDTLENDYLRLYVNANCQQWIHDIGWDIDTTHEVFFQGGTIVATTSNNDTLVGRFMGDNDWNAGAQDKLYLEQCEPDWEPHFWILYTKEIYIEATHLSPPNHFKWWWWEIAKQVKFFKPGAPENYQRIVIKYVKVKRQDPPGWWPDLAPFNGYENTYIGMAMDIDAPWDSADTDPPTPNVGDENATNLGFYDAVNNIAYLTGFGLHEHPEYSNYHAGIALAEGGSPSTVPFATAIIKNNHYLYPQSPWGWLDGELYQLAKGVVGGNPYIEHPDSLVDRSIVMTAAQIPEGSFPNQKAEFTVVEVLAPTGLAEMQALVATAREIVAAERAQAGLPAACGDANGDFVVNVGDVVYLVSYLYKGGPEPYCPTGRGDVNNDGVINVGDV